MPDVDLPLQPIADQIRRREFATVRRGYDPEQVRGFLLAVADGVKTLEDELRSAKDPVRPPATQVVKAGDEHAPATPGPDPYEVLGQRFAGLLGTADKEAQRLVAESKTESTRILSQARAEAERIRGNAQTRADEARAESLQLLEKARIEAERALTGLSSRREALLDQLQTMQSRLLSAADDLAAVIEKPDEAAAAVVPAKKPAAGSDDADPMDPRYEDLWVSTDQEAAVDIPDLASIELDFDDDRPPA